MNEFIQLVIDSAIAQEKTGSGIDYLILPKDFHPTATQIPYFAIADKDTGIIAISEQVPKIFKHVWVMHESECLHTNCAKCPEITLKDIEKVKIIFMREELECFLKARLEMFRGVIQAQPQHEWRQYWFQSMAHLDYALSRL